MCLAPFLPWAQGTRQAERTRDFNIERPFFMDLKGQKRRCLSFDRGKIARGSPKVVAERSRANKLLGFSAPARLFREIMRCLKVLAGATAWLCWGLPPTNSGDAELMQETQ